MITVVMQSCDKSKEKENSLLAGFKVNVTTFKLIYTYIF